MSTKENEIRKYLEEKVDPFLKPLLLDLMKNKPGEVYDHIKNWIETKGKQINDNLHKKTETETSHHYDNLKKSVASIKQLDAPQEAKPEGGEQAADPLFHTHEDGTSHSHPGGDHPHAHTNQNLSKGELNEADGQQDGSAPAPVSEGGVDPQDLPKSSTQLHEEHAKQESQREVAQSQSQTHIRQSQTQLAAAPEGQHHEHHEGEQAHGHDQPAHDHAAHEQPAQDAPAQDHPAQPEHHEAAPHAEAQPEGGEEPKPEETADKPAEQ